MNWAEIKRAGLGNAGSTKQKSGEKNAKQSQCADYKDGAKFCQKCRTAAVKEMGSRGAYADNVVFLSSTEKENRVSASCQL